jgi:hypothetical protein
MRAKVGILKKDMWTKRWQKVAKKLAKTYQKSADTKKIYYAL